MHIHALEGSWLEHSFWRGSFKLASASDLKRILTCGIAHVVIDTDRGLDVERTAADSGGTDSGAADTGAPASSAAASIAGDAGAPDTGAQPPAGAGATEAQRKRAGLAPIRRKIPMPEELERAARICSEAKQAVTGMFQQARMGRAIDSGAAAGLVGEIAASVARNPSALISVARLKTVDDYTYMHSVAVCALMISLAGKLGLPKQELREVGLAGLLHDVGKMAIPLEILNKPGALTKEEFVRIQTHPVAGHRMLLEGGGVSGAALDVCLHHHEKIDGSGYPDRLRGTQISLTAKMGAVCDVYDAITSDRPYKKGLDPSFALHKMDEWKTGHFEPAMFIAFVQSLGIYPVGSLVRLKSGRLGVIVEQTEGSLIAPKVKAFFSIGAQTRIAPQVIDLSKPRTTDKIVSREDPATWGFADLATLWQDSPAGTGS